MISPNYHWHGMILARNLRSQRLRTPGKVQFIRIGVSMCYVSARLAQHARSISLSISERTILIPQTPSIEEHSVLNTACGGGFPFFPFVCGCDTGTYAVYVARAYTKRLEKIRAEAQPLRRTILDLIMELLRKVLYRLKYELSQKRCLLLRVTKAIF